VRAIWLCHTAQLLSTLGRCIFFCYPGFLLAGFTTFFLLLVAPAKLCCIDILAFPCHSTMYCIAWLLTMLGFRVFFFYPSYTLTCPTRCHTLCPRAALPFYQWSQSGDPMTISRMVGRGTHKKSSFFDPKKRSFLWSYRSRCPSMRWARCRNYLYVYRLDCRHSPSPEV
jgi:hypothetical protein